MHCNGCGYENPPEHRFCGMCGRPLPQPVPVAPEYAEIGEPTPVHTRDILKRHTLASERMSAPLETRQTYISGPSLLGLGNQPSGSEFSYLLEDEPRRSPARLFIALVIIVAAGAGAWWQVRQHGGVPWVMSMLRKAKQSVGRAIGRAEDASVDQLNRSRAALMQSTGKPNATTEADLQREDHNLVPRPGQSLDLKEPASPNSPSEANGATSTGSQSSPPGRGNTEETVQKPSAPEGEASTAKSDSSHGNEAATGKPTSTDDNDTQRAKPTPRSEAEPATLTGTHSRKSRAKTGARNEPDQTAEVVQGEAAHGTHPNFSTADTAIQVAEKYLYGHGVRQDCNRALDLLRPAADSNAKARSLLGTMYATGHCVPRDLPSSYRWFALALREEPNNVWVSRNLQSVWNQMSDSERRLAVRMTK